MQTYTYTARDVENPNKVLTITLYPEFARINLTGFWDQLKEIREAEETREATRTQLSTQARPAALKVIEAISGPVHLDDFKARLKDEKLTLTAWQRVRGLRLAPVNVTIDQVDNPDAAQAFVEQLSIRREKANDNQALPGFLDYWAGWFAMLAGVMGWLFWRQQKDNV